jgi:hypothetical protein
MYPAEGLFVGDFTVDDLPETVVVNSNQGDGAFTLTLTNKNSGLDLLRYDWSNNESTVYLYLLGEEGTVRTGVLQFEIADETLDPPIRTYGSSNECLITGDGNLTAGDDLVEDQFEDTYTLTSIEGSIVVTRVSLCRWELPTEIGSPNLGGSLEYYPINPMEGQPSPAWIAGMDDGQAMSPAGGEKTSPNLSSPVGTYTDLFLPSVTVS